MQLEPQEGHPLYRSRDFEELMPPVETDPEVRKKLEADNPSDLKAMMQSANDAGADTQQLLGAIQGKGSAEAITAASTMAVMPRRPVA